jgi:hypothetical protein
LKIASDSETICVKAVDENRSMNSIQARELQKKVEECVDLWLSRGTPNQRWFCWELKGKNGGIWFLEGSPAFWQLMENLRKSLTLSLKELK